METKTETNIKTNNETKHDISFDVRPSSVFYEQWYQIIKELPLKERDRAYKYIFEYSFYGIEPQVSKSDKNISMSYVVFGMAKPNIDSAQKRYDTATENGKKGGRPTKLTELVKTNIDKMRKNGMTQKEVASELGLSLRTIQRYEYDKSQNHNVNINVNDNDNVNNNDNINNNNVASNDGNIKIADAQKDANASHNANASNTNTLTQYQYKDVMDLWESNNGRPVKYKPDEIAEKVGVDKALVKNAITEFKENHYQRQTDKYPKCEYQLKIEEAEYREMMERHNPDDDKFFEHICKVAEMQREKQRREEEDISEIINEQW